MIGDAQSEVVTFLQTREAYSTPVGRIEHFETHISHVFLTGDYAFKLKKAVQFDFLDFSTLELRKHFCEEEVRLNSRFSPELYLGVIPVSRQGSGLVLGAGESIVEYLVKMRQFDDHSVFDSLSARGELKESLLLEITDVISQFHLSAQPEPSYWGVEYVAETLKSNFDSCARFSPSPLDSRALELLRERSDAAFLDCEELLERRQRTHVRALHADLHLRNMCVFKGKARLFDGIEFNPELSNCDVWADFAFFVMDLLFRGRGEDAALVWNHYLQETDDFEGLRLLDLYVAYRAAVRAKVNCLALNDAQGTAEHERLSEEAARYLQFAASALLPGEGKIVAVGGLSGSGKSTLSSVLARRLQGVHVRSDAVRKHLVGVPLSRKAPAHGYSAEMSTKTYQGLLERTRHVLQSGKTAVVDAVFHSPIWREHIKALASELRVPFTGIWCSVSPTIASERLRKRVADVSDADESVLELQRSYSLGEIDWHQLDTSNEDRLLAAHAAMELIL